MRSFISGSGSGGRRSSTTSGFGPGGHGGGGNGGSGSSGSRGGSGGKRSGMAGEGSAGRKMMSEEVSDVEKGCSFKGSFVRSCY